MTKYANADLCACGNTIYRAISRTQFGPFTIEQRDQACQECHFKEWFRLRRLRPCPFRPTGFRPTPNNQMPKALKEELRKQREEFEAQEKMQRARNEQFRKGTE